MLNYQRVVLEPCDPKPCWSISEPGTVGFVAAPWSSGRPVGHIMSGTPFISIYIYTHNTHTHIYIYIYSSICWYQTDSNSISKNSVFWRKKGDAESDPGLETDGKANSQSLGIAATTWHGGETWEGKLMVSVWAFSAQIGIYMIYTTCMHIYIYILDWFIYIYIYLKCTWVFWVHNIQWSSMESKMMQLVFTQIQMVSSFKTRIEFHHPDGFHQPNGISLQGSSAAPGASESSQAL